MALGKGLGALLGEEADTSRNSVTTLPLAKIEAAADQPRKNFDETALEELAESIRLHGVLQPIAVRRLDTGYYRIVAGERRWRAARLAGLKEVPVVLVDADEREAKELTLIENLQREDLDDVEAAYGFRALMDDFGLTQEEVAGRMGLSRSNVANTLRLLNLPTEIQDMIRQGTLTAGHARAVMRLSGEKQQIALAQLIARNGLSVRQAEMLAARMAKAEAADEKSSASVLPTVDYLADVERDLSGSLGHRVRIVSGKKKGRIEIEYYGGDDLQTLIDGLSALKL